MHEKVLVETQDPSVVIPSRGSSGSAGYDISAYIEETLRINAGETLIVPTGLKVAVPDGYELQIRSRSGMALKGIFVANQPGTIDSDYRGKVGVLLYNSNDYPVFIDPGMRIAQCLLKEVIDIDWVPSVIREDTQRGSGGYGSTG